MGMIEPMLGELQHEAVPTRKMLEAVPASALSWKPHAKSFTLGKLAGHIAEIPGWTKETITLDVFEMDPTTYKPFDPKEPREIVALFDKNLGIAVEHMQKATDAALMATWAMKIGGRTVFSMPRIAVLRGMILNHMYHHRGQLSVYLRMQDVPLPKVYGPTADDPGM
ncbi:MAG: DinB family protein [Planctomycetota bacterium]|nr:DinB family protein [Planctomycetota bacterium]